MSELIDYLWFIYFQHFKPLSFDSELYEMYLSITSIMFYAVLVLKTIFNLWLNYISISTMSVFTVLPF